MRLPTVGSVILTSENLRVGAAIGNGLPGHTHPVGGTASTQGPHLGTLLFVQFPLEDCQTPCPPLIHQASATSQWITSVRGCSETCIHMRRREDIFQPASGTLTNVLFGWPRRPTACVLGGHRGPPLPLVRDPLRTLHRPGRCAGVRQKSGPFCRS